MNIVSPLLFFCKSCEAFYSLEQLSMKLEDIECERDRVSFCCPSCDTELASKDVTVLKEAKP